MSTSTSSGCPTSRISLYKFDIDVEWSMFAKMIMKHDLPFLFSEYEYFRSWCSFICPTYKFRSRNTLRADCMKVYKEEKVNLYKMLERNSSKVSITTDLWTSDHQNLGYCCVSCHFLDDDWVLHKKIIAFYHIESPYTGEALGEWLKTCILEWNLDKKLYTVVVDNASNNEPMVNILKTWLNGKEALHLNGDLFHT